MEKILLEQVLPRDIEKRSFEIITEELGDRKFPKEQESIIKRVIHTSADFDYADNLCFSENAVALAKQAIMDGACIVTDTQMAKAGINKRSLKKFGGEADCKECGITEEDSRKKWSICGIPCIRQVVLMKGIFGRKVALLVEMENA